MLCYTVIIDYFNVSCCLSAAHSEIKKLYAVAQFESEKIDIVT